MNPVFLILILILSILPALPALEQTARTTWRFPDEAEYMYRIREGDYRAELMIRQEGAVLKPSRLIWESPFAVMGNLRPEGLWRFLEAGRLLSPESSSAGFRGDSGAGSLEHPGAALYLFPLGFMIEETGEGIRSGLWLNGRPSAYWSFDLACQGSTFYSGKGESEEWFPDSPPVPSGPLFHGGGEVRGDGPFWSVGLTTAFSAGPSFRSGTAFLADGALIFHRWDLRCRYLQHSEHYRTSGFDHAGFNWELETRGTWYPLPGWLVSGEILTGKPRPGSGETAVPRAVWTLEFRGEAGSFYWKGSFRSRLPDWMEPAGREFLTGGRIGLQHGGWSAGLGAEGEWNAVPAGSASEGRGWTVDGKVKRTRRRGGSSCLALAVRYRAASICLEPVWEESVPAGPLLLSLRGGCRFPVSGELPKDREQIILRVSAAWTYRD